MAIYIECMGQSVQLPLGETVVGREVGCGLRFNDPAISRKHLRFVRREDDVFVEDLGSANGTQLNGRLVVAPIRIRDGDLIVLGSRELTVRVSVVRDDDGSTLNLKDFVAESAIKKVGRAANTLQMAATVPPLNANQRCPQCAAAVSYEDDECSACKFQWGSFRPSSQTDVRITPLSRRRHERHSVELHLIYVSSELEIEAMTRDLSRSGVFVCTQVLDPPGTACQLTVLIDGGPALEIRGVVRRVVEHDVVGHPIGLGIEFVGLGVSELQWIDLAVSRIETATEDNGHLGGN